MDTTQVALSPYARNILDELQGHVNGFLKVREPDLIRLSKVPGTRIIQARDELEKCIKELEEHDLISCERQGERYIIRNTGERNW